MFSAFVILTVAALACNGMAFPQNNRPLSQADGFVFDGPADRPPAQPDVNVRPPTRTVTTTTTTSTEAPNYGRCVVSCPATPEHNPVCGTDRVVYSNPGRLNCAAFCGKDVKLDYYGQCNNSDSRG